MPPPEPRGGRCSHRSRPATTPRHQRQFPLVVGPGTFGDVSEQPVGSLRHLPELKATACPALALEPFLARWGMRTRGATVADSGARAAPLPSDLHLQPRLDGLPLTLRLVAEMRQ